MVTEASLMIKGVLFQLGKLVSLDDEFLGQLWQRPLLLLVLILYNLLQLVLLVFKVELV